MRRASFDLAKPIVSHRKTAFIGTKNEFFRPKTAYLCGFYKNAVSILKENPYKKISSFSLHQVMR